VNVYIVQILGTSEVVAVVPKPDAASTVCLSLKVQGINATFSCWPVGPSADVRCEIKRPEPFSELAAPSEGEKEGAK
jgi:hypothetical protein